MMLTNLIKVLKVGVMWPRAVEASVNKKMYAKSIAILDKIPKFEKILPRVCLLRAQNEYLLGDFLACDLTLRECVILLDKNTVISKDDSNYMRVYINNLYRLLQKKYPTTPPNFYCPTHFSTRNVDVELIELFPV